MAAATSFPNLARSISGTEGVLLTKRKSASRGDNVYFVGQLRRGNSTFTTPYRL